MLKKLAVLLLVLSVGCAKDRSYPDPVPGTADTFVARSIAAGGFGHVDDCITDEHFPQSGPGVDVSKMSLLNLAPFGNRPWATTLSEIESAIRKGGYRSATLAELLTYGRHRQVSDGTVVALGSVWTDPSGIHVVTSMGEMAVIDRKLPGGGYKVDSLSVIRLTPHLYFGRGHSFLVVRK